MGGCCGGSGGKTSSEVATPEGMLAGGADSGALTSRDGQREGSRGACAANSLAPLLLGEGPLLGEAPPPPLPPTSSCAPMRLQRLSAATCAVAPLAALYTGMTVPFCTAPMLTTPPRCMPGTAGAGAAAVAAAIATGTVMAATLEALPERPAGYGETTRLDMGMLGIEVRPSCSTSSGADCAEYISGHAGGSTNAVVKSGYNWCSGRCFSHSGSRTRNSLPTGNRPSCNHSRIVHPGIGPYSCPTLSR